MPCQNHPRIDLGLVRCARCAAELCSDCAVGFGGVPLCGPCKTERLLDRLSGIPLNQLDFASISHRFIALLLDGLLLGVPIMGFPVAMRSLSTGSRYPIGFELVPLLLIPLLPVYEGWMLASRGQTLGMRAVGIYVVNADGGPLMTGQAWGRAVLHRLILSCIAIVDYIPALLTQERTAIHDLLAKTRVIRSSYVGPACPYCGTTLVPGEKIGGPQVCLTCAGSFEATPFSPPSLYLPPLALAAAGPTGGTPCAVHAGNAAVGPCERCGLFACALCRTEVSGQELCAACLDRLAAEKALPAFRTSFVDFASLAAVCGLLGLFFSLFGVVTGPLTLVLAGVAARRRQRGEEGGGWGAILLAVGLGIAQIAIGIYALASLSGAFKR